MDFALFEDEETGTVGKAAREDRRYAYFEIVLEPDGSLHELGHGAMGTTYRARDTVLHSEVALKVIRKQMADSGAVRARFLREARTAAKLRHPNVASVFHYGEQDGECYYAMELVEGETLEARVRRDGPLPADMALEIAAQVARALAAAEAQGLVHRDLKPSNLMLVAGHGGDKSSEPLLVKVIDFGLAKAVTSGEATGDSDTRHGFVGTPAYASPEQFSDKEASYVDTRSDIYSLGVTLWYLLSGHTPFVGRTLEEIQAKQIAQPLPIEQLSGHGAPAGLVLLLRSMLAADPGMRPQTARALLAAVARCREQLSSARRTTWRVRFFSWAAVFIAVLATSLVLVAAFTRQQRVKTPLIPPDRSVAVLPFENRTSDQSLAFYATGMQDEITAELADIEQLKVVGADSTRRYPPGKRDFTRVGSELGVGHLVEGDVERTGTRVRATVRLIDVHHPSTVWTKQYDQPLAEVAAVQRQVTRDVATELRATLSAGESAALDEPPTIDPIAYDLYLRASESPHHFDGPSELRRALQVQIDLLEQAVTRDPKFVLAYCVLAELHDEIADAMDDATPEEKKVDHRTLAEVALQKARRLKPENGRIHLAQAHHFLTASQDFEQAHLEIDLARRTLPNNAELEQTAGMIAREQGRWQDAVNALEKADRLQPREMIILVDLSRTYRNVRRYEEADAASARVLVLKPAEKAMYDRFFRAMIPAEQRADLAPLRAALAAETPANASDASTIAQFRLVEALCAHDPDAVSRTLAAVADDTITVQRFIYPKAWFAGIAARMRGDPDGASAAFAAARPDVELMVQADADDARALGLLAIIDASLGRKEDALREGRKAWASVAQQQDGPTVPIVGCELAVVYAWTGEHDLAFALLNDLTGKAAGLNWLYQPSYGDFRLNPVWNPLRDDPRFEEIVQRLAPPRRH